MRIANVVMALAFAVSVLLQYNDPDPLPWMVMYAAAAVACVVRVPGPALVGIAAVAASWAGWTAAHARLEVPLGEALGDWGMHSGGSEEAREVGGLLLVVTWMIVRYVSSTPTRDAHSVLNNRSGSTR